MTRFQQPLNIVRRYFKMECVVQWGRVRRLEGGDDMYSLALWTYAEDRRDATFVRVSFYPEVRLISLLTIILV